MRFAMLVCSVVLLSAQVVMPEAGSTDSAGWASTSFVMADSGRVSTPVAPAVPTSSIFVLDGDNVDNANNALADGTTFGWRNAGTSTVIASGGGPMIYRADRIGTHDVGLFNGAAGYSPILSGSTTTFQHVHNTGIFDFVFFVRRDINRAFGLLSSTRSSAQKGFHVGFDATGHVQAEIRNGAGTVVAATTTGILPLVKYSSLRVSGDGTTLTISIDGVEEAFPFTGALTTGASSGPTYLGAQAGAASYSGLYFNGAIAWFGCYTRALSTLEWAGLQSFFSSRYGAQSPQTAYVALGDSNTMGQGSNVNIPWPMKAGFIAAATPVVANYGVSGQTAAQARTLWTASIRNQGYSRLVLMIGTNTIRTGTVGSGASAFSSISATLDEARADGLAPVVMTVLPGANYTGWNAQATTELLALNTSLTNYASTYGLALVDAWTLMRDPADTTRLNPTYNAGDHIHINQAGSDVIAAAVKAALGL